MKNNLLLNLFICLIGSFLLFFSFPPFNFWYLSFFSFVPIFLISDKKSFSRFFYGLFSGFIFYSLSFSWLNKVSGPVYLLLALYLSIYWAIFVFLIFSFDRKKIIFLGACIWFFLEIIMSHLLTGFPWLVFGLSQYKNYYISQIAKFTGIYGISFKLIASNLFIYTLVKKEFSSQMIFFILFIIFFYLISEIPVKKEKKGNLQICLIQPNFQTSESNENKEKILFFLYKYAKNKRCDIIIFPEGTYQSIFSENSELLNKLKDFSKKNKIGILIGTFTEENGNLYNSSVFINNNKLEIYKKIHLVPYGEFILGERFRFIKTIFYRIAGYYPKLKPGNDYKTFEYKKIKFSTLICYENIFPEMSYNFLKNGTDFFIVITNDSWFGNSFGPYQHFYHNVFRAIETGRYFLQAGLTGITGIVNPEGKIEKILVKDNKHLFFEGILTFSLPVEIYQTFYSKYGIYPFFLFCLVLTGLLICRN
ncbi:MAG: apolipoprotein N-acyltransferase [Candidatus Omnitrophica bacterium]|nr:apolipoprotein N-acyltransferase [Candidatus Omnitrophota bacterium]MCM8802577.1 apolipoprotein N-acyltransferase [Candidatus Omnitrophota bacterium]